MASRLVILNKSAGHSPPAGVLDKITFAIEEQLHSLAKRWGEYVFNIVDNATASGFYIALLDNPDVAEALGYHDVGPDGKPYARVFLDPIFSNGGTWSGGSLSVSAVVSHEVVELCVAPETRVLTADLQWVEAGSLEPGERLVAFDEFSKERRSGRPWRATDVVAAPITMLPSYELTFADGSVVRCSADHKWLVTNGARQYHWIETKRLLPTTPTPDARGRVRGSGRASSQVVKPLDPWQTMDSFDAGYLAAALDGEGSITQWLRDVEKDRYQTKINFAQNDNVMLERVRWILKDMEIAFSESSHISRSPRDGRELPNRGHHLTIQRRHEVMRLLGAVRPTRLLQKLDVDKLGTMTNGRINAQRLVTKEYLGEQPMSALQTTTGTFIAEGFASHNCGDPGANRWANAADGTVYALELCDAVEADYYHASNGVALSNFLLPAYFNPFGVAPFDEMRNLTAPFEIGSGGYAITMNGGKVSQVFGEHYDDVRLISKVAGSRTAARMNWESHE